MQNPNDLFSLMFNKEYMFTSLPIGFELQTLAFILGGIGVLSSILAIWFFKKRRNQLEVTKEKRHIISRHAKINLVLWIVFLVFWFLRTQQTQFLSMRFFLYFLALASLVNTIMAVLLAIFKKPELVESVETTTAEEYQKYLPRKKK